MAGLASGAAGASVFRPSRASAQATPSPTVIRLCLPPSDGVTSVVYAKNAGLFDRAGLDVRIEIQSSGAAAAAAVASGVYDIGESSISSILQAHEKGLPFTVVAPAGIYDMKAANEGALLLADSPLRLDRDADNQILGVTSLSSVGHDAYCAWVDAHGGDARTLKFLEIPFSLSEAALEQHRVVATESAEPTLDRALQTGKFRLIPTFSAIAPTFLVSLWFTTKDFSNKNPEAVRTFARVVAAAAAYTNTHHAETAPMMSALTKIPVADILRIKRAVCGSTLSPALIQPAITAAAKYGTLTKSFPAQELIDSNLERIGTLTNTEPGANVE